MATKLFCDSNCEIWYTELETLNLELIKMPYILDGKEYAYDCGKETDFDYFYKRMREGALPTTSALNEYNFTEIFEPVLQNGDDILYIGFSSNLSASFGFMKQAADKLAEKYPDRRIAYFDTLGISGDCGYQVYYAAKYFNEGHTVDETLEYLEVLKEKVRTFFVVDDLNHLKRGGRVSSLSAAFGTMLQIKPVLHISEDGKLEAIDKVKGSKKVMSYFIDKMKEMTDAQTLESYRVVIGHANCEEKAQELKGKILEVFPNADIVISFIGPVVGSHCGEGTVALFFLSK
ncbi:MAG: DegV family protein [Bacillota bacterium]